MVRMDATADDSLAAIRARSKLGIAIAAMIRMMATTISSSINEKPFCFRISIFPSCVVCLISDLVDPVVSDVCKCRTKSAGYPGVYPCPQNGFIFSLWINLSSAASAAKARQAPNLRLKPDKSCQFKKLPASCLERPQKTDLQSNVHI